MCIFDTQRVWKQCLAFLWRFFQLLTMQWLWNCSSHGRHSFLAIIYSSCGQCYPSVQEICGGGGGGGGGGDWVQGYWCTHWPLCKPLASVRKQDFYSNSSPHKVSVRVHGCMWGGKKYDINRTYHMTTYMCMYTASVESVHWILHSGTHSDNAWGVEYQNKAQSFGTRTCIGSKRKTGIGAWVRGCTLVWELLAMLNFW